MTLYIALAEPACRSRDLHEPAERDSTDHHPSDRAIAKGKTPAAWYFVVAATLSVGMPLLESGIADLGRLVAASPPSNAVVYLGSGVAPCTPNLEVPTLVNERIRSAADPHQQQVATRAACL
jgi:hypothetical protein